MNVKEITRLLNKVLAKLNPALKLSGVIVETNIETKVDQLLAMVKPPKPKPKGIPAKPMNQTLASLSLANRKPGPSPGGRVNSFVSSLVSAGVPLQRAFDQAVRLNVGGGTNDR